MYPLSNRVGTPVITTTMHSPPFPAPPIFVGFLGWVIATRQPPPHWRISTLASGISDKASERGLDSHLPVEVNRGDQSLTQSLCHSSPHDHHSWVDNGMDLKNTVDKAPGHSLNNRLE
jgi:hypothetical protein